jgi:hypothetical protein
MQTIPADIVELYERRLSEAKVTQFPFVTSTRSGCDTSWIFVAGGVGSADVGCVEWCSS